MSAAVAGSVGATSAPGFAPPAVGTFPVTVFNETFPVSTLDGAKWTVEAGTPLVDTLAQPPLPSPPYALHLRGSGSGIVSRSIDLSRVSAGAIVFSWEQGGALEPPDPQDDLTISANLTTGVRLIGGIGGGGRTHVFNETTIPLPPEAFHAGFSMIIENTGGNGKGHWFVDDIRVVTPPAADLPAWLPLGFGALGVGVTVAGVYATRHRTIIEEIFLLDRSGLLIRHATRRLRPEMDGDVLGGMLTAVQAFVKDSFHAEGELNEIRHGEMRILIEGGQYLLLAAVLSRGLPGPVPGRMRVALDGIEAAFGSELRTWNGDVDKLLGTDLFLEELIAGRS